MVKLKPETKRGEKPLLSARVTAALTVISVLVLVLGVFGASAAWEKPAPSQQSNDTAQNLTKLVGKLPIPRNVTKNVTTSASKGNRTLSNVLTV